MAIGTVVSLTVDLKLFLEVVEVVEVVRGVVWVMFVTTVAVFKDVLDTWDGREVTWVYVVEKSILVTS